MQFIANGLNKNYLTSILPGPEDEVDAVLAAVAYGSMFPNEKDDFIGHCVRNRYRLDLWMRYDHTVPVAVPLLRRLLQHERDNIFTRLIPDRLHSKVIWWKGYGAYIGSANLSDRAWNSNIEAGLFLSESDLQRDGMDVELENFFDELSSLEVAMPLNDELIREMAAIDARRSALRDLGKDLRKTPVWEGIDFVSKKKAADRKRENFRAEWHATLQHLRDIGDRLHQNRPTWVGEDVPLGWQIDQFLHAYYYNKVGDGRAKPYEDYYSKNRSSPSAAVNDAIRWWRSTPSAPSNEDVHFVDNAPLIKEKLARDKVIHLSPDEFTDVCSKVHATREHVIKMDLVTLGRPDLTYLSQPERFPLYANWLLKQRNSKGWSVLELLEFVLYGGKDDDLWERLYAGARDPSYSLPHYGLNTLAEVVGWARPEVAPPRNGRTSKALRALGYDVRVY